MQENCQVFIMRAQLAEGIQIGIVYNPKRGSAMLKAMLRKGVIVPLEPLAAEWEEGAALEVAKAIVPPLDIDAWAKSMNCSARTVWPTTKQRCTRPGVRNCVRPDTAAKKPTWDWSSVRSPWKVERFVP